MGVCRGSCGRGVGLGRSWLVLHQLANKKSERPLCAGRHNAISKQSQFVGAIVTGDAQLGITQPIGRPIKVSTQRGLSLPFARFHWPVGATSNWLGKSVC